MPERNGKRKTREQISKRRVPTLGHYLIITDTKETERNYIHGLRNSIPKEIRDYITIEVFKSKSSKFIEEAERLRNLHPQYGRVWIIFDRDQVKNFNNIIAAVESKAFSVGWSNPCIEIWLHAYLGTMPSCNDSVQCVKNFDTAFQKATGQKYSKADKDIYPKLNQCGNEEQAMGIAEKKLKELINNGKRTPEDLSPATTLHILINEIKNSVKGLIK